MSSHCWKMGGGGESMIDSGGGEGECEIESFGAGSGTFGTLVEAALQVLNTADPMEKARIGEAAATLWLEGAIVLPYHPHESPPQELRDRPARLPVVKLVPPQQMPKLGKGGSLRSRQAILHSLVHTESWAIDLSWDIIARFGGQESMPREFFTDFVRVAQDEGRHFTLLSARLQDLGSFYGAFQAHDGLWDSAMKTSGDLLARLAVEHCVHEARGLDVLPSIIARFRRKRDECTANLLETVVYPEEITHCAAGLKWFRYLWFRDPGRYPSSITGCARTLNCTTEEDFTRVQETGDGDGGSDDTLEYAFRKLATDGGEEDGQVIQTFHATVRQHFSGVLKPPFNEQARKAAGFGPEWYEPLAVKK